MVRLNVYERDQHQHVMFSKCEFLLFSQHAVSVLVALMSAVVIGVLSATTAAIVASIIMWCVMKKKYKHPQSESTQDDKNKNEHTSVVYDVPVLKDHQNQTISTQDNVAYGGTILPLQQNVAYEQHN